MFKKFFLALVILSTLFYTAPLNIPTASRQTSLEYASPLSSRGTSENDLTKKNSKEVIVVIDPGHGGDELGTYYDSMYEKNVNLDISLKLGKLLEKEGIKIIYTRTKDVFVGLQQRANIANDAKADLFISVHNNRMPGKPNYKGTETLYHPASKSLPSGFNGVRLARLVQKQLVKELGTVDNGIIPRPNLAVLRHTTMPAIIAEIAYISNRSDRDKLATKDFRQKAALALSKAVVEALHEMGVFRDRDGKWLK